jgi:hypothetical protein
MVPLYNGIQQHVKPDERLVLLAWPDDRAQYELDRLDDECERRCRQIEERQHVQVYAPALLNVALLVA